MKYAVYQNSTVMFQGRTRPEAELICLKYNLMHEENQYRFVLQTERMERMWDGHYD